MSRVLTDEGFEKEVLSAAGLSLVDFWAEWCAPCKALEPTIESIATEYEGSVNVFKLDIDSNPKTPAQFNIRGIPTVLLFKNGKVVDQFVGTQSKEVFSQTIKKHQKA